MIDWLTRHETVVALAICGGALSALSWVFERRGAGSAAIAKWCNAAAYALMAASVLLFIVAGFRGSAS